VEIHVHFIAIAKVLDHILWPLVCLRKEHRAGSISIHESTQALEESMRFGQVFAIGALTLEKIGGCIHTNTIHALIDPELNHAQHFTLHLRVIVVQIGLMREKTVPIKLLAHRIEGPVRLFGI